MRSFRIRIRTRRDAQRRIMMLVGAMASIQIILDALDPFVGRFPMLGLRIVAAGLIAAGAMRFETYKLARTAS